MMNSKSKEIAKVVVLVPYPAQGHVTPMLQLGLALKDHGLEAVMVIPEFIHRRIQLQPNNNADRNGILFVSIPDATNAFGVNEPTDFFAINCAMESKLTSLFLERFIRSFNGGIFCMVVDLLASWAIKVGNCCSVPVAGFWPAMLPTYNLIKAIPDMIQTGLISEFGSPKHQGKIRFLPGQPMLRTEDLPWLVGDSAAQNLRFLFWLQILNRITSLRWLLVNSFPDQDYCCERQNGSTQLSHLNPHVFQVGPLTSYTATKNPSFWEEDMSCLKWLDLQTVGSVVYVSFGSWVGPIGEEKIRELALGLEATQRPFVWVLGSTWRSGLPTGFLERVASYGKLVSWAPQMEVLQHEAVACYITHCGWNSTLEAIQCGKCLVCYPIAGDQFVNCTYIVKVWQVGVKMDGMGRSDVKKAVRMVMDEGGGLDIRKRMMKLKERVMSEEGISRAVTSVRTFIDHLNKAHHICK